MSKDTIVTIYFLHSLLQAPCFLLIRFYRIVVPGEGGGVWVGDEGERGWFGCLKSSIQEKES